MPHTVILLRHGESQWNAKDLFCGWIDVRLTDKGCKEAARAGEILARLDRKPDVVYTSKLSRSVQTANIALETADRLWLDTYRSWRLNERHYGALQGRKKEDIKEKYGKEQFMRWRRSYDDPPPLIDPEDPWAQFHDDRYHDIPVNDMPRSESIKQIIQRLAPFWDNVVCNDLRCGKTVLIIAHGNSLRALIKHVEGVSDDAIATLLVPNGEPFILELDDDMRPIKPHYFLDINKILNA